MRRWIFYTDVSFLFLSFVVVVVAAAVAASAAAVADTGLLQSSVFLGTCRDGAWTTGSCGMSASGL